MGVKRERFKTVSYKQQRRMAQVKSDYLKFIPFSVFILIPGAELLLPGYIAIFPNAVPTQFMSDEKKMAKLRESIKIRNRAVDKLLFMFPQYIKSLESEDQISKKGRELLHKLRLQMETSFMLPTDLLEHRVVFEKYMGFEHMDP